MILWMIVSTFYRVPVVWISDANFPGKMTISDAIKVMLYEPSIDLWQQHNQEVLIIDCT